MDQSFYLKKFCSYIFYSIFINNCKVIETDIQLPDHDWSTKRSPLWITCDSCLSYTYNRITSWSMAYVNVLLHSSNKIQKINGWTFSPYHIFFGRTGQMRIDLKPTISLIDHLLLKALFLILLDLCGIKLLLNYTVIIIVWFLLI